MCRVDGLRSVAVGARHEWSSVCRDWSEGYATAEEIRHVVRIVTFILDGG